MGFSSGLQSAVNHIMQIFSHSSFSLFSTSRSDAGSVPEPRRSSFPGRCNTWTWPGSGSWVIWRLAQRFPLTDHKTHKSQESKITVKCTEHWLSFTAKQQSFAKHTPSFKRVIWLEKGLRHHKFALLYTEGFYRWSSPLLFIQISSGVRGVWFPVIGLMTFICFFTVWLSSIW